MFVELVICVVALVATVALVAFGFRWFRSRQWIRFTSALAGIAVVHFVAALLVGPNMRAYVYSTANPSVTFLECPFKGVSYETMLSKHQASGRGPELFRTFGEDWWNYYRWHDYATHPRWKLPRRTGEQHKAEPLAAGNAGVRLAVVLACWSGVPEPNR
jgi:hypothetical protein